VPESPPVAAAVIDGDAPADEASRGDEGVAAAALPVTEGERDDGRADDGGAVAADHEPAPARDLPDVPESAAPEIAVEPPVGDPALIFADGRRRALVLRVLSDAPVTIAVAVDGTTLQPAAAVPAGADRPVPVSGIVPGRVYTVGGRHVAYWGGDDYFYLKLDSVAGVTVTLNGRAVAVPASAVGREWELTAATAGL